MLNRFLNRVLHIFTYFEPKLGMKLHPLSLRTSPGTKPAAAAPQAPGLQLCLTFAPDPPGTKPEAPMGLLVIPNPFISVLNPLGQSLREKADNVGCGVGLSQEEGVIFYMFCDF